VGTNKCQQYVPTLFVHNKGTEGGVLIDVNSMYRPCLYIIRVQRVGTNRCQQYVQTLFGDNKSTEGEY
jgi:hypothetical protein